MKQDDTDDGTAHGPAALRSPLGPVVGTVEKIKRTMQVSKGHLKEVIAVVRPSRHVATRKALEAAGIFSYTTFPVLGRSRQRGLRFQSDDNKEGAVIKFLPKQYFSVVVLETQLSAALAVIMKVNRTGVEGATGDGKIFVVDIDDAVRISTSERGAEAVS